MKGRLNTGDLSYTGSKQLCWDCAKATNSGCSWSDDFTPVEGWTARKLEGRVYHGGQTIDETYLILDCPEFVRNSYGFGQYRMNKGR